MQINYGILIVINISCSLQRKFQHGIVKRTFLSFLLFSPRDLTALIQAGEILACFQIY